MSRALRRQLERHQRRNICRKERVVSLPAMLDEFTVFDMPQTILDKISNGEIEAYQGRPVFRDNAGVLCEVCPALKGWIETWERINASLDLNINLRPLTIIHNKLDVSMLISKQQIDQAKTTLTEMRHAFRTNDRSKIASVAKTAQISMLMENVHAN